MKLKGLGYCLHHHQPVDKQTYDYKGCSSCRHFIPKEHYVTVEEASELLNKSQPTVRRYIKTGKLEAEYVIETMRFGRRTYKWKFYIIEKKSLEALIRKK
jgi:excisionase family DNA binding protein